MKDWLNNMFQLKKKLVPLATGDCCLRTWKKMVSTSQKISFNYLKYGPSLKISDLYQWRLHLRGKTLNKRKRFLLARKSASISWNEGLCLKKYFSTRLEKKLTAKSLWEMEKKTVATSQKLVSPSKTRLSLAGIFLKNWIPSNFINDFHYQKQSCKILFCLGEIVFLYLVFFASGNHSWIYVEANF